MSVEIKVPNVGESIQEVQIGEWYIKEGEWVSVDTPIVGLETDKATFDVPAPQDGKVTRITIEAGTTIEVGSIIGLFEPVAKPEGEQSTENAANDQQTEQQSSKAEGSASSKGNDLGTSSTVIMPAAERLMKEKQLSPKDVTGTGPGGRILKEDVVNASSQGGVTHFSKQTPTPTQAGTRMVPMTGIRKAIARRLVEAQQNAALLTTFNETDMSAIKELRATYQPEFKEKYGVKLGFMSFFVKAIVDALMRSPQIAAQIKDDYLIYPETFDIGVAVGSGKGLVVPVLRSAETLSFAEIEQKINEFGEKAMAGKIMPQELQGGCFTISNGGVYGSLLSTPIVNPPQSGVLGMHNIVERPVALNGQVVIRPMMYLALTYDHRVVDGREAVTFLKRICESIADPTRLILEI